MKRVLMILAILLLIGVVLSTFLTVSIQAIPGGNPEEGTDLKDPHFHTGTWTTCMNELKTACNSN